MSFRLGLMFFVCAVSTREARAQKGYEFEIYDTKVAPRSGGDLELHTNFVAVSAANQDAESAPLRRAFRSAFEVSTGLTSWLEGSVYAVGYARAGRGIQYVGNRARLNAVLPQSTGWPVRLGLSQEIGYARRGYAEDRWAFEISPIAEMTVANFSIVANPAFERSLDAGAHRVEFEPRVKIGHSLGGESNFALEYYGGIGPVLRAEPASEQHHQLFASFETELAERFEVALSVGHGFTKKSDRRVMATKIEYHWGK